MVYNADHHVHQYCDGTDWVALAASAGNGGAGATPTTSGLIGHWKLDDGSGTNANDDAGSNDGTLTNGPTWTTGKISGAVQFDGSNDYVSLPNSFPHISDGTISMWIKSTSDTVGTLLGVHRDATSGIYWLLQAGNGASSFFTNELVTIYNLNGSTLEAAYVSANRSELFDGNWHHIVVTDDTVVRLYIDGVEKTLGNRFGNPGNSLFDYWAYDSFKIGAEYYSGTSQTHFNGLIDDVRIYNRALSSFEIQQLYSYGQLGGVAGCLTPAGVAGSIHFNNDTRLLQYCDGDEWRALGTCGEDPESSKAAHWKLDESSGTSAADSTTNALTGTLTNGPTWQSTGGQVSGALSFDGSNDYVAVTDPGAGSVLDATTGDSITLTAWIKPANITGYKAILAKGTTTGVNDMNYDIYLNASGIQVGFNDASNTYHGMATSSGIVSAGAWQFVAATMTFGSATGWKIYYNGVEYPVTTTGSPYTTVPSVQNNPLWIGAYNEAGGAAVDVPFNGQIDDVRVYRRNLSATDIKALYDQGRYRTFDNGKVAHWPLDASSGTTAADLTGNAAGTTVNSPTWTPAGGRVDGTLDFDGTDDRIDAGSPAALDNLAAMTIVGWIRPDTLGEGPSLGRIIGKTTGNTAAGGWTLNLDTTNRLTFDVDYATTDFRRRAANNSITLGAWQQVAVTWTGSATATNAKLYVNGVEASYATTTNGTGGRVNDAAQNIAIGNPPALTDRSFDGRIDDLRIYNRVLTAAEIKALYNSQMSGYGCTTAGEMLYDATLNAMKYCDGLKWRGLGTCSGDLVGMIAHWKLDETSGTTANDSAGSSHGTLVNGPVWTSGQIGGALDFDGTDDYVTVPSYSALNNLDSLSVCGWFYIESGAGVWRQLVSKYNGTNGWNLYVSSGDSSYGFQHRSGDYAQPGGKTFDEWQHFCGTAGDGFVRVYRNGVLGGSVPITGPLFDDSAVPVSIGANSGGWELSRGPADDVRIYNRVLSAEEIMNLYLNGQ